MTRNGLKDATSNPDHIAFWWGRRPKANIGLPADLNGFAILDVDPRHGGDESFEKLNKIALAEGVDLTATLTQLTGGNGVHYLFAAPPGGITGKAPAFGTDMPGLDTRGRGTYVVAAPSVHISGGVYTWVDFMATAAPWPELLTELLIDQGLPTRPRTNPAGAPTAAKGTTYATAALAKETDRVEGTAAGGRNHQLNTSAFNIGQIVGAGLLDETHAEDTLTSTGVAAGLPDAEARKTVQSGLKAGMRKPRSIR